VWTFLNIIYFETMRLPFNATCGDVASWRNDQTDWKQAFAKLVNFSSLNHLGGTKNFGVHCPRMSPVATGLTMTVNLNRKLGYKVPRRKLKFFKDTYCQQHSVILLMSEWERMFFAKRQLQNTNWKNTKINCKRLLEEFQERFDPFPRVKTMLCIPCKSIQC